MSDSATPLANEPAPRVRRNSRRNRIPFAVRRKMAAALSGVSIATWDRMSASGANPAPSKAGGVLLWGTDELRAWVRHGCPSRREWSAIWAAINRKSVAR